MHWVRLLSLVVGLALATALLSPAVAAGNAPLQGGLVINLEGADIREAAAVVLDAGLGVSYTVDPRVQGRITLRTTQELTRPQVLAAFEESLSAAGATLLMGDGIARIVPLDEARRGAGAATGAGVAGFGAEIIPLQHVAAEEVLRLVRPMLPETIELQPDPSGSALVVRGSGAERTAARDLTRIFDVDWLRTASVALEPLQSARAATVADELGRIFPATAAPRGPLTIIPVDRLNALLVITQNPGQLEDVRTWIRRLDQGGISGGRELHLYYVQNGKARDLARMLASILDLAASDVGGADASPAFAAAPRAFQSGAAAPAGPPQGGGDAVAVALPAPVTGTIPAPEAAIPAYGNERFRILADVERNALIVLATAEDFKVVDAHLRKLDEAVVQVLIEATIAEVALTDELRYGVQWFFKSGDSRFTLSNLESGLVNSVFPGFSYGLTGTDGRAVLDALDAVTDVTVVSSPQILVLNNHTATLQVGDDVPVLSRSAQSVNDPDAPIVNTIEFRRTGVILTVTPRIGANNQVMIDIDQEVSDVVPTTTSGIDSPTIQQRRVASSVVVQSGETIALGGLIRSRASQDRGGIPLLSKIPGLGALFSSTRDVTDRSELIVMLTPRVVRTGDDLRAATEDLRRRMDAAAAAYGAR